MADLHIFVKFTVTIKMDEWYEACEFWFGGKLCTCLHIIYKILNLKLYMLRILWMCAVQTQPVEMQMGSKELKYNNTPNTTITTTITTNTTTTTTANAAVVKSDNVDDNNNITLQI